MGSSAQDKQTQQTSSAAATQLSAQQQQAATQAQGNSNAAFGTLFGRTDANGTLSGGTASQFLDPNKLTQTGLNGTYANTFATARDATNKTAADATGTTLQQLQSRGQGAAPAGFAADQLRKAQMDAADTNAKTYSGLSQQQLSDSLSNYWQANQLLNQYGTGQATNALTGNSNAQSTNTSLYGTASQQKQTAAGALLGAAAGVGSAALLGGKK